MGGWTCSHQRGELCDLLKKACDPGDKGCVLYGKAVFSNPENPSNAAVERREEMRKRKGLRDEMEDAKFF
ncbi:hypothetical protein LOH54_09000 [Sulfurimonas sp. HSL-3221]|uniref:hypothetical protein n=1 Tax=Thiomicrolovo sulfuroxydans TaxID=2894755 RepID=UPI001E4A6D44|nr:hypothetical protein [Sulfurimonas sp. HSL-3221]UFS61794.1 hypothetical protein LOH54_09000 [Sulfurimonas sp. HSL-3221]